MSQSRNLMKRSNRTLRSSQQELEAGARAEPVGFDSSGARPRGNHFTGLT